MDALRYFQEQKPAAPPAGTDPNAPPPAAGGWLSSPLIPIAVIIVLFYFMVIRKQMKEQKQRDALLKAIKKNDHVVTTSGIYGIVGKVDEKEVMLVIDEKRDVRIRVQRSAIVGVEKVAGASDDKAEAPKEEAKK